MGLGMSRIISTFDIAIIDRGIRLVNGVVVAHCRYTHTLTPDHRTAQPAYHISIWLNTGNCITDLPYIVPRVVQYWFNLPYRRMMRARCAIPTRPLFFIMLIYYILPTHHQDI